MATRTRVKKPVKVTGKKGETRQVERKTRAKKTQSGPRVLVHRAKVLDTAQFKEALESSASASYDQLRTEVILRLSFEAGLRAREIAGLRWSLNLLDAKGQIGKSIHVTRNIGKRSVEREIPMSPELRMILVRLYKETPNREFVVFRLDTPETGSIRPNTLVQFIKRYFKIIGFEGCTSHSGRRTFITRMARIANLHGASLVDVQQLAGHRQLQTTALYIEPSSQQHNLVAHIFGDA